MDTQIKDNCCRNVDIELEKIAKMQTLTDVALSNLQKLTDTKKNFLKIELLELQIAQMKGEMNQDMGGSYGRSVPVYEYSSTGNTYNRMGGSYDYGYSRDNAYSHLEAAMRDAHNEHEREEIRQLMSKLYR